ncbi:hypothetical protein [Mycolicibacterium mageritense]|uniref:DUF320 domain-containing protein n=1 Tax=Mycolicibacterium mageritense TaxID=53462 RepID=A0AAI8XPI4_MYCME|nr:hypothetical protein [Mycolicibacterium mageritense]BDY30056.1 hypothetical protein hbim_03999 [Mycolicibacterium mageritense]
MKISTFKRVTVGTALGGALLLSAGMGLANAEARDGQVDVVVGTAGVLEDVPIGAAAQVAANLCDRPDAQVTPVAQDVDVNGTQQNVCSGTVGAIDLRQNDASSAEGAAEEQEGTAQGTETTSPSTSAAPTTTTAPAHAPANAG